MSMMGISTEDKFLIKSLRENEKYEQKLESWWTESASKKTDNTGTVVRRIG